MEKDSHEGSQARVLLGPIPRIRTTGERTKTHHLQRTKKDHKKAGRLFDRDNYKVFTILTNDKEKSEKEVIEFYNKRGSSELNFRDLKGDYSWKKLPFSDINHNHTFLILTALVRNVITAFTRKASEKIRGLKPTSRLKRLRYKIITIPGEWVMKKGEWILRLFSSNKEIRKLAV
ncbi:transposase [Porphyromonas levii]|uniref:transposase n=1 Tax=Porphyromonas levii TaxID=28114 RepID=UPI003FA16AAC